MTEKIAVVAPIPSASVRIAAAVNPGARRIPRRAYRTSWRRISTSAPRAGAGSRGPTLLLTTACRKGSEKARKGPVTFRTPRLVLMGDGGQPAKWTGSRRKEHQSNETVPRIPNDPRRSRPRRRGSRRRGGPERSRRRPRRKMAWGHHRMEKCLSNLDLSAAQTAAIDETLATGKATLKADGQAMKATPEDAGRSRQRSREVRPRPGRHRPGRGAIEDEGGRARRFTTRSSDSSRTTSSTSTTPVRRPRRPGTHARPRPATQ